MKEYRVVQVSNRNFYIEERFILFLFIRFWIRRGSCYSSFNQAEHIINILLNEKSFKSKIIKYYP